ncbi:hypothetical protein ACP70R_030118 [Stipagrostis hirtigluma subsp. patula]
MLPAAAQIPQFVRFDDASESEMASSAGCLDAGTPARAASPPLLELLRQRTILSCWRSTSPISVVMSSN